MPIAVTLIICYKLYIANENEIHYNFTTSLHSFYTALYFEINGSQIVCRSLAIFNDIIHCHNCQKLLK